MCVPQFQRLLQEEWPENVDQPSRLSRDAGSGAVCDAAHDRIMRDGRGYLILSRSKPVLKRSKDIDLSGHTSANEPAQVNSRDEAEGLPTIKLKLGKCLALRLADGVYHIRQNMVIKALVRGSLVEVQKRTSRSWTISGFPVALLFSLSMKSGKRPSARLAEVINHIRRTMMINTMMKGRLTEVDSRILED